VGNSERRRRRPLRMPKHRRKRRPPKRSLALPDLEQTKSAVLNSLTSKSGQRTYDHAINEFVDWYCSEPRLAFNRTVVLRYRIHLEQRHLAPTTINLRLAAVRRVAYEALIPACSAQNLPPASGESRAYAESACDWVTGSLPIRPSLSFRFLRMMPRAAFSASAFQGWPACRPRRAIQQSSISRFC
jgi:hypothetical protein